MPAENISAEPDGFSECSHLRPSVFRQPHNVQHQLRDGRRITRSNSCGIPAKRFPRTSRIVENRRVRYKIGRPRPPGCPTSELTVVLIACLLPTGVCSSFARLCREGIGFSGRLMPAGHLLFYLRFAGGFLALPRHSPQAAFGLGTLLGSSLRLGHSCNRRCR